jgi:hypothetical protein
MKDEVIGCEVRDKGVAKDDRVCGIDRNQLSAEFAAAVTCWLIQVAALLPARPPTRFDKIFGNPARLT